MTFREKSLWVTLAALLLAFGFYFYAVHIASGQLPSAKDLLPFHAGLFGSATVLMVMVLVLGHAAIAILDRRWEPDERDFAIELRAERHGSMVLATGVFLALCAALLTEGNAIMAHVLIGFWVAAQAVDIVAQLLLHHRGG